MAGLAFQAQGQTSELKVEVSGLRNYKGQVVLMLWPDFWKARNSRTPRRYNIATSARASFLAISRTPPSAQRVIESLQDLTVSYTFTSLPAGDYAVLAFHDENNNGQLDTG